MTLAMALTILAATIGAIRIWLGRALPRTGFVEFAVPLALLPIAAAAAGGAWQLAAVYREIGRTGSGSLASPFAASIDLVRVMLIGAGLALLLLGLAVVIAVRRRSQSGLSTATESSGAAQWLGAVVVIIVAAAVYVVAAADETAVLNFALLVTASGDSPVPPPPFALRSYSVGALGRPLAVSIIGGLTLCFVIVAWAVAAPRFARHAADSRRGLASAMMATVVLMTVAGWYSLRLASMVSWASSWMERVKNSAQ